MLYEHLDGLRERTSERLAQTLRQTGGTPQARTERDVLVAMYTQRLAQLDASENGLCFGRIDSDDDEQHYIGRLGIRDEDADYKPLLLDWRAPAARPFYLATPVSPEGVRRRRHIKTIGRQVTRLDDEVLDLAAPGLNGQTSGLNGEAALLAALNASRTGQMTDIVETIQVEQDWIIRAPNKGVLVVQGGPGTGKTAVALHRAAFLLYTHREQLARRVVLVIGPSPTFLRYVGQVLPSLGETSVLMSTIADLYPGITARREEPVSTARLKGRLEMAEVIAAAVRDRQGPASGGLEVRFEGDMVRLDRRTCVRIRDRARRARLPHNQARPLAHRLLIEALARKVADRIGYDVLGGGNLLGEEDVDRHPPGAAGHPGGAGGAGGVLAGADPAAPARRPVRVEGAARGGGARPRPGRPGRAAARARRRVDRGGRAAAGRGGGTARRGRQDGPGPGAPGAPPADRVRPRGARSGLRLPVGGPEPRGRGRGPVRLRHPRRRAPGQPLRGGRRPDRRGTGGGRPDLGVRAHRGGRGAGAVPDGVADADAALPVPGR